MTLMDREQSLRNGVRQKILDIIGNMNLKLSTKLLSETQLATKLEVSRSTIRVVLTELEREGKIIRRHGSGTFVNPLALHVETTIHSRINMYDLIVKNGYEPSVKLERVDQVVAGTWCDQLSLLPTDQIFQVHSSFLADGKPCMYCVDCMDARWLTAQQWAEYDGTKTSIFDYLRTQAGIEIQWDIIRIRSSDSQKFPPLHNFFSLNPGQVKSVVLLEITNFNDHNEPVLLGHIYVDTDIICLNIIHDSLHMQ